MNIELTENQFRLLVDLVYIGNWVLNGARDHDDLIVEYDEIESLIFSHCPSAGMSELTDVTPMGYIPSRAFENGGIHDAIAEFEDAAFFEILSEELSFRDMDDEQIPRSDFRELSRRVSEYMDEFEQNGTANLFVKR